MLNYAIWIEIRHKLKAINFKLEASIVAAYFCSYSAVFEKRTVNLFDLNQDSFEFNIDNFFAIFFI